MESVKHLSRKTSSLSKLDGKYVFEDNRYALEQRRVISRKVCYDVKKNMDDAVGRIVVSVLKNFDK